MFVDGNVVSLVGCPACSRPIVDARRKYCSCRCRWRAREHTPRRLAYNRVRCRYGHSPNMWLRAAPIFGDYLPGGIVTLEISASVNHERVAGLHGFITSVLDHGHAQEPDFSLVPSPMRGGWALYCARGDDVELARRINAEARVLDKRVQIKAGAVLRLRAPKIAKPRGKRTVSIYAITPVVIRSMGSRVHRDFPTADTVANTLRQTMARRLGVEAAPPIRIVRHDAQTAKVFVHGKQKQVVGWVGGVELETSAEGEWLLRCAALGLGLGGRTSLGFGRIRVESP